MDYNKDSAMVKRHTLRILIRCISILIVPILVISCGHSDNFRVEGSLIDGASINIRYIYLSDGAVRTGLTASNNGKFSFEGSTPTPTIVEIYDNEYRLLGRFAASNGDDISLKLDRHNRYAQRAAGNEINTKLSEFYNSNADDLGKSSRKERNRIITEYIAQHPLDAVSEFLLVTEFDAHHWTDALFADSLLTTLTVSGNTFELTSSATEQLRRAAGEGLRKPVSAITYKAPGNKTATFVPSRHRYSLITISDGAHGHDSVLVTLRKMAKDSNSKHYGLLDLNVDTDTTIWKRTIRTDSAEWSQGWAAGSVSGISLNRLHIPAVPYYVIVDSTGMQIWRGESGFEASQFIDSLILKDNSSAK